MHPQVQWHGMKRPRSLNSLFYSRRALPGVDLLSRAKKGEETCR
jgi:hypothetical protein